MIFTLTGMSIIVWWVCRELSIRSRGTLGGVANGLRELALITASIGLLFTAMELMLRIFGTAQGVSDLLNWFEKAQLRLKYWTATAIPPIIAFLLGIVVFGGKAIAAKSMHLVGYVRYAKVAGTALAISSSLTFYCVGAHRELDHLKADWVAKFREDARTYERIQHQLDELAARAAVAEIETILIERCNAGPPSNCQLFDMTKELDEQLNRGLSELAKSTERATSRKPRPLSPDLVGISAIRPDSDALAALRKELSGHFREMQRSQRAVLRDRIGLNTLVVVTDPPGIARAGPGLPASGQVLDVSQRAIEKARRIEVALQKRNDHRIVLTEISEVAVGAIYETAKRPLILAQRNAGDLMSEIVGIVSHPIAEEAIKGALAEIARQAFDNILKGQDIASHVERMRSQVRALIRQPAIIDRVGNRISAIVGWLERIKLKANNALAGTHRSLKLWETAQADRDIRELRETGHSALEFKAPNITRALVELRSRLADYSAGSLDRFAAITELTSRLDALDAKAPIARYEELVALELRVLRSSTLTETLSNAVAELVKAEEQSLWGKLRDALGESNPKLLRGMKDEQIRWLRHALPKWTAERDRIAMSIALEQRENFSPTQEYWEQKAGAFIDRSVPEPPLSSPRPVSKRSKRGR